MIPHVTPCVNGISPPPPPPDSPHGVTLGTPAPQPPAAVGADDTDSGNLLDSIDPADRALVYSDHVALDGRPHVTPEDIERAAADQIAAAKREELS